MFSIRRPQIVLMAAAVALVASIVVLPTLGRVFLPEFQERSLVIAANLYLGVSLDTTNQVGFAVEDALKNDSRFEALVQLGGD